jgi:hypothetical protein
VRAVAASRAAPFSAVADKGTGSPRTWTRHAQDANTDWPCPRTVRSCGSPWFIRVHSQSKPTHSPRPVRDRCRARRLSVRSPRQWARPRTRHIRDLARTQTVREQATATSANHPQTVRSRVEAVRVNQRRDCMSPVVASMYCSPQPAALHIAPAARLRGFCL